RSTGRNAARADSPESRRKTARRRRGRSQGWRDGRAAWLFPRREKAYMAHRPTEISIMSGKFKPLAEGFWVAPQIEPGDIAAAKALGVRVIINNRPDGEEPGQPDGAAIEQAAKAAGLAYR